MSYFYQAGFPAKPSTRRSGLLGDQSPGRPVPWIHPGLEERIQLSTGHRAEVQGGRPDPPDVPDRRENGRHGRRLPRPQLDLVVEPRPDQRKRWIGLLRAVDRSVVGEAAAARPPRCRRCHARRRARRHRPSRHPLRGDRHGVVRNAVEVVHRAVERVDQPAHAGRPSLPPLSSLTIASSGRRGCEAVEDDPLRRLVHHRHDVRRAGLGRLHVQVGRAGRAARRLRREPARPRVRAAQPCRPRSARGLPRRGLLGHGFAAAVLAAVCFTATFFAGAFTGAAAFLATPRRSSRAQPSWRPSSSRERPPAAAGA